MKKELFFIAGVAAIFAGCARETEVATPETGRKHITIQASLAPETKTTVEITNGNGVYSWAEEETIAVIESEASEVTQFTVSNAENGYFEGTIASGNTLLGAVSPESAITEVLASEGEVVYSLEFSGSYSADQTNAILVAAALEKIQSQDAQDPLYKFQFKHVGGLMKVTYTNIPVGTKALRYTTNQNIVGEVANLESLTGVEVTTSDLDGGMTAVVNFATPVSTPNTTHVFYVPVPTGNYGSFEIALLDDAGTVIPGTLRSKTQNFTVARTDIIKIPTVTLPAATLTNEYVKVTSDEDLTDGVYLIVSEDYDVAFDGSLTELDAAGNTVAVTISNEKTIASSFEVDAATFTIDMTNGTILSSSGMYIGRNSDTNGLDSGESALTNSISIHEDGNADVVSANDLHLRFNSASNQSRFRYYKSGQEAIQLYKRTSVSTLIDPALSFSPASVSISDADYGSFVAPALTNAYHVPVVWSSSDENEDYAMLDTETGEVLLTGKPGTFTITASSAASSVFAASSASYTVTVTSSAPGYVKVTTAPTDWSGTYLIVDEESEIAATGVWNGTKGIKAASVTINNDRIESTNTIDAYAVSISNVSGSHYTVYFPSTSLYLGYSGNANESRSYSSISGNNTSWTVSLSNNAAILTNVESNTRVLRSNYGTGNGQITLENGPFRCYTGSTGHPAVLYKLEDNRQAAGISWSANSASATIADGDVVTFTAPTLSNPNNLTVSYSSTDLSVATISNAGVVSILDGGTTTIRAAFAGDETYKPATAEYILTVTDNRTPVVSYDFETIAELNALVTSTSYTYSGKLTNAVVSFVPTANAAIVKDATGSVMFYKSTQDGGHGLLQGKTYTGDIEVTAVKYNDLYSEITVWDAAFTGNETPVAPESVTLASLVGNYDDYQNAYVQVSNLTVTNVNIKNITVTGGTDSYEVYFNPNGTVPCGVGDVITAVGTVTKYGSTEQIKVWDANDITVTTVAPKAITFTQPSAGGSFTVSVGGNTITSGTTVASGTTVTLTATPANDYTFDGWTVTGATVADASAATTTFTMGTSAVNISASFSSTGGPAEYTIQWGPSYNSKSVSGYIENWDATMDGFTVNMANWNNNNNSWNYVKCGRKNNSSVATIITDTAIPEAIKTVTITIDALTASKINSITLYASSSKTSGWTSVGTFTKAVGNQSVIISSPASNKYYKIEVNCASGSSNGLLTLSKAVYTTN